MAFCPGCSYENNDNAAFCASCGRPLNNENAPPGPKSSWKMVFVGIAVGIVLLTLLIIIIGSSSPSPGSISVSSSPSDASVYLDNKYQGKTPINLDDVKEGSHEIALESTGYEDWSETINVDADKEASVSPTLTKEIPDSSSDSPGSISVASSPSGASIYLDGTYQGITPMILNNTQQGSHTISLKLVGYEEYSQTAIVENGKQIPILAVLPQNLSSSTGSISVESYPDGASIYLDDTYEGETPKILEDIKQGSHTVTLKLTGYEDWSETIKVDADKEASVSPKLTEITDHLGSISVSSDPSGASVYLDDEYQGKTPVTLDDIKEGSHEIALESEGYEDWSETINVDEDNETSVSQKLTETRDPVDDSDKSSDKSAEIEDVSLENGVWNDGLQGVKIHVTFNAENLKGESCMVFAAFFDNLNGLPLTDSDGDYALDGKVAVWQEFIPESVDSSYSDVTLFIPYEQFHYVGRGTASVKYKVVIGSEDEVLDTSDWYTFSFTQY